MKIPTPELYVFYNGPQDAPVEQEMKFSDAFMAECDKIALEVTVKFINVNYEKGAEILKRCKAMEGGILADFLKEHGVMSFLFEKLTREECEAIREADGFEEGYAKGRNEGLELGKVEGIELGKAEGYEEGEAAGELKVAGAMKARGMTIDEICEITGLKRSQVEELWQKQIIKVQVV